MKRSLKTFTDIDGKKYKFNAIAFNSFFKEKQKHYKDQGKSEALLRQDMASKLGISPEAIKSWRYMYNGPADLDLVKSIADYFSIDYSELLFEPEDENMNANMTPAFTGTNSSVAMENAAAAELYQKLFQVVTILCKYYDYAWDEDRYYSPDEEDEDIDESKLTDYQKEYRDQLKNPAKYTAKCLDLYYETKDVILSYAMKVSMETIKASYQLLREMVDAILYKTEEEYKEYQNDLQYDEIDWQMSAWGHKLDQWQYEAYFYDTTRKYYEKLFSAFSEYPRR